MSASERRARWNATHPDSFRQRYARDRERLLAQMRAHYACDREWAAENIRKRNKEG